MPLYNYFCKSCGRNWENFRFMRHRNLEVCKCGAKGVIALSAKIEVFEPHYNEAADAYFTSKKQKKQVLAVKGLVESG